MFVIEVKVSNIKEENITNVETIIKNAKEGDTEAVNMLIDRYKYLIIKEAGKYHIPGYAFEDLVQHGYLSVIKAVNKYKLGRKRYDGYFINTIKTNYKDLLRGKIKHNREIPDSSLLDINTPNYQFTIEDQIIAYEQVKKLYMALDKLPKEDRNIIERFYFKGDKLTEIACDLDSNYYKTVRIKERALQKLKELLL